MQSDQNMPRTSKLSTQHSALDYYLMSDVAQPAPAASVPVKRESSIPGPSADFQSPPSESSATTQMSSSETAAWESQSPTQPQPQPQRRKRRCKVLLEASTSQAAADSTYQHQLHHDYERQQQPQPQHEELQQQQLQQLCSVCGDKALGFNFDAVTCESCKAFFRRNAVKEKPHQCNFHGNCEVTIATRKFCPACRLSKCFRAGMKKEWILGAEQLQKRRERAQRSPSSTASQYSTVLHLLAPEDDETATLSWSDRRPLSQACQMLLETVRAAIGDVMDNVDINDSQRIRSSNSSAVETPFAITLSFVQRFVQFVKRLPEYSLIQQEDMVALIKGGVFHFTLMRGACTYSLDEDSFQFESNRLGGMHRMPLDRLSMSLSSWPAGPQLLSRYREFLRAFSAASGGDRLALTLLQLVDFYNPSRPQLCNMRLIDRLQRGYMQLLWRHVEHTWPMTCSRAVFFDLLNRLSDLDRLATDFSNLCHSVGFACDELSPLLVEVFELRDSAPQ